MLHEAPRQACLHGRAMTEPTAYEVELKGSLGFRALRPFMDDFGIVESEPGTTRLTGVIRDPSHLYGLLVHLASMNIEIISIARSGRQHPSTSVEPPGPPD